jgi:hypothetical protein
MKEGAMTAEQPSDDIKKLWRDQKAGENIMTLDDIRKKAEKFQSRIRKRNLREYAGAAIVVIVFGWYVLSLPGWMTKTGSALCIVAALFISWQLHRRASACMPVQNTSVVNFLECYRRELVRQRDALKSVWLWYLAPFVPGMALMGLGRYFQFHARSRTIAWDHQVIILSFVIVALVFGMVWLLSALGASKLQRQIDELDRTRIE